MKVREVDDATDFDFELKEIFDVFDDEPWFTPEMMNAARWLAEFYLCPLSLAMGLFMPGRRGKKISARYEKVLTLKKIFDEKNFSNKPAQLKILKFLSEHGELSLSGKKFSSETVKSLVAGGFVRVEQRRTFRDSYAKIKSVPKPFELTAEQVAAIAAVEKFLVGKIFQGFLLFGVTGSGKTQVYIELAKKTRRLGRRVIILVPEIALTGQIVANFKAYFADVAVIHSRLSIAERSDTFHKIRGGEVGIVIGARSALFTPLENVRLTSRTKILRAITPELSPKSLQNFMTRR